MVAAEYMVTLLSIISIGKVPKWKCQGCGPEINNRLEARF